MKQSHLEELIKHITRQVLKEYASMFPADKVEKSLSSSTTLSKDDKIPPQDAMTDVERKKLEREKELDRQRNIKQTDTELSTKKKEMEFNRKKIEQQKRFEIPKLTKTLQQLKGAKI